MKWHFNHGPRIASVIHPEMPEHAKGNILMGIQMDGRAGLPPGGTSIGKTVSGSGGGPARDTRPRIEAEEMDASVPARVRAPMPSDSALGRKVRELRRSRGMTQKELASAVGVTGAQLHRYETGATRVAASRMIAIAEALGVRPDVLLESAAPEPMPAMSMEGSTEDDLVELIQLFSAIGDQKNRNAILAVARMMASTNPSGGGNGG